MPTATADPALMARLAAHTALRSVPVAEHAWLAAHGRVRSFRAGEILTRKGELATELTVVFSGSVAIRLDRGAGSHKVIEWRAGDIGGALPYSRGARPPADAVVEEPTEMLLVPLSCLPEMTRECPVLTTMLVHAMVDRARQFNAADLRDEKLVSLGRLAAGLAHELNNPAAAAARTAKLMRESLEAAEVAASRVGAARLSDAQLAAVNEVRALCAEPAPESGRSAIARADREDALAAWLSGHGANEACAEPLAETGLTIEALDRLHREVQGDALDAALRWISAGCQARALAAEVSTAAARIVDLVQSVKGFTFMDRAPTLEPVDIRRGISDTLTMLRAKSRARGAEITTQFAPGLPRVRAVGAELNQVWMNLVDNALDAIPQGGHIALVAEETPGQVVVTITDDGPGIPDEILGRIFDPFFTTKGVGEGTGLGLDIVRQTLRRHGGEVDVESRPGRTEFRVVLRAETQDPTHP